MKKRSSKLVLGEWLTNSKISWSFAARLLLASSLCLSASAQQYSIDWATVDGGGGTSTGGVYSVSATLGQPDASETVTNAHYSITGGFWALPTAVQTPVAPMLFIVPAAPGFATISWTPPTPGFVLQENWSLAPVSWTNAVSGATNPITVPTSALRKFYRLVKL